jgi:hypothetical protein
LKNIQEYFQGVDGSAFVDEFSQDFQEVVEGLEDAINLYETRKIMMGGNSNAQTPQFFQQYFAGNVESLEISRLMIKEIKWILKAKFHY